MQMACQTGVHRQIGPVGSGWRVREDHAAPQPSQGSQIYKPATCKTVRSVALLCKSYSQPLLQPANSTAGDCGCLLVDLLVTRRHRGGGVPTASKGVAVAAAGRGPV